MDCELYELYELDEPVITELPNQVVLEGYDDTTIFIENSITPAVAYKYNALIPYKQELVEQKEVLEFSSNEISSNIIPHLLDLEQSLLAMGDDSNG